MITKAEATQAMRLIVLILICLCKLMPFAALQCPFILKPTSVDKNEGNFCGCTSAWEAKLSIHEFNAYLCTFISERSLHRNICFSSYSYIQVFCIHDSKAKLFAFIFRLSACHSQKYHLSLPVIMIIT